MERTNRAKLKIVAVAGGIAALAGCQTPPKAPPPPPPAPVQQAEIIPPRPIPPGGAAYVMAIPQPGVDGTRQTVNYGLSADERAWHFRAAWNVAALNCLDSEHQPILDGYKAMLKNHSKALTALNTRVDQAYRKVHGGTAAGRTARDKKMTTVYNYFALPPARGEFCQAAMSVAQASLASPKTDLLQFAGVYFPLFEQPFENFFLAYEDYQRRSADWDARYGARYGASQPGYVAVQQARAGSVVDAGGGNPALTTLQAIDGGSTTVDPLTGLAVPVLPVNPGQESTPIVQPLPTTRTPGQ